MRQIVRRLTAGSSTQSRRRSSAPSRRQVRSDLLGHDLAVSAAIVKPVETTFIGNTS